MNTLKNSTLKARSFTGGQTFMLGGSIVLLSLSGFYFNLRRMQNRKEEQGTVPHYEHLLAHYGSSSLLPGTAELPMSRYEQRTSSLPPVAKEHNAKHSTVADFKLSAAAAAANSETTKTNNRAHLEQPTPQRPKMAGSSLVYTKSPDYVKSYEKTLGGKSKRSGQISEINDERKL